MIDSTKYLKELMELYSRELPAGSQTVAAIKRGAAWTDISQTAEEEELHYISSAIFMAQQEGLADEDTQPEKPNTASVLSERIGELRKHLPANCETARAIDRKAPWAEISQCAEQDGLHEIVGLIFEAEQESLNT